MDEARPLGLRFTAPALADLDSILTYLAAHSPQGAVRVGKRLREVIELLTLHPNSARGRKIQRFAALSRDRIRT